MDTCVGATFFLLVMCGIAMWRAEKKAKEMMQNEKVKEGAKALGGAGVAWVLRKLTGK